MVGDLSDILLRLQSVLPSRWFGDSTPILDALLTALSCSWTELYSLLQYVQSETRIATATDCWLDVIADDYFGTCFVRRPDEPDSAFRARILLELVRERGTRHSVWQALLDLTGRPPNIFEPADCGDTGGYGTGSASDIPSGGGLGHGVAGGWGKLQRPVRASR